MKLTKKAKVMLSTLSAFPLALAVLVGLATPAIAPSKAEAQILIQKKYQNYTRFQPKELAELLGSVGFQGQALRQAWAVAMKESHGNALSYNGNRKTGDHSYGLFQINMIDNLGAQRRDKLGLAYNAQLLNPVVNAKSAFYMSSHGTNWSAWKGTKQTKVRYWLAKYPYKAHKAKHKATPKGKAVSKATPKAVVRKSKAIVKATSKA